MDTREVISGLVANYSRAIRDELSERLQNWKLDLSEDETHEVVGGLIARQVSLATQFASSPRSWNGHIAPLILRAMAEVYISLAWILRDPIARSQKYILYGLGQEKLELEHKKMYLVSQGKNPAEDENVKLQEAWINSQRFTFLTEVNVGSWSDVPIRDMAIETGCEDIYNLEYAPFSASTHSMWNHTAIYNLEYCSNPLHRFHRIPMDKHLHIEPHYLYLAARYVKDTLELFDKTFDVKVKCKSGFEVLIGDMKAIQNKVEDKHLSQSLPSKVCQAITYFFKRLFRK